MSRIRVLVVDDSRTMRQMIAATLANCADIEVVGEATDPLEAREAIKQLNPDVLTLDVEMPRMNGLDFLEKLMRLRPMPVVMVSSLTGPNCDSTVEALEIGAVDCVVKPGAGDVAGFAGLPEKIRMASTARFSHRVQTTIDRSPLSRKRPDYVSDGRVVAIGSSTGGVEALTGLLARFPPGCPPTVVTQHMPPNFTRSFAARLDKLSGGRVSEARDGAILEPGQIYIAPGGEQHLTIVGSTRPLCRLVRTESVSGHRPSVDVLFGSVAKSLGEGAIGVILTGMGRDGAQGLLAMRNAGARTIGQNEATSLIYGMPRVAFEIGAVERQLPLDKIGPSLLAMTNMKPDRSPCP